MSHSQETKNKVIISRLIDEYFLKGNVDIVDRLIAPEYKSKGGLQGSVVGPDGARAARKILGEKLEILSLDRMDLVAEGDRVTMFGEATVRHVEELWGIPATRKVFKHHLGQMWRLKDGKLVENWFELDRLALLRKLGVQGLPETD
jgi:predicted ester cyclase